MYVVSFVSVWQKLLKKRNKIKQATISKKYELGHQYNHHVILLKNTQAIGNKSLVDDRGKKTTLRNGQQVCYEIRESGTIIIIYSSTGCSTHICVLCS